MPGAWLRDLLRNLGPRRSSLAAGLLSCILISAAACVPAVPGFHRLENFFFLPVYRAALGSESSINDVLVLGIDRKTFTEAGKDWTRFFPVYKDIVERLTSAGARLIAFDLTVNNASDAAAAAELLEAIKKGPPFVLATRLPPENRKTPVVTDGAAAGILLGSRHIHEGFIDFVVPRNSHTGISRVKLVENRRGRQYISFALTICSLVTGVDPSDIRFPNEDGYFRIPFTATGSGVPLLSCADLLAGRLPASVTRNRIVIVGPVYEYFHDRHSTPVGPVYGAQVHAAVVHALLSGAQLVKPGRIWTVSSVFAAGFLALAAAFIRNRPAALAAGFFLVAAWIPISMTAVLNGYWFPCLAPALAAFCCSLLPPLFRLVDEAVEGLVVKRLFGQFVSREVLSAILREREALALSGATITSTVLFSDIRGFTSLSSSVGAKESFAILNRYLAEMVEVIFRNGGRLDKFMGDGIMAVFGAPFPSDDDALRAVRTALEMLDRLKLLNQRMVKENRPELSIGIGICTGPVHAGVLGTNEKMEYAVIGDTVNTASRLEHLTKEENFPILISASTMEATKQCSETIPLGKKKIRGLNEALEVFALVGVSKPGP